MKSDLHAKCWQRRCWSKHTQALLCDSTRGKKNLLEVNSSLCQMVLKVCIFWPRYPLNWCSILQISREMCRLDSHLWITCRTADTLQTCQGSHTGGRAGETVSAHLYDRAPSLGRERFSMLGAGRRCSLGPVQGTQPLYHLSWAPHCYFIHWHSGQKNKSLLFKSLAVWPQEETNIAPCNIKWKVSCYTNRSKHFPRNVLFQFSDICKYRKRNMKENI